MNNILTLILCTSLFTGCNSFNKSKSSASMKSDPIETNKLSVASQKIRDYISNDIVIAHRGSTYWAPEETESAYRWARNIGADYLELDLQMTKDSVLVALHDDSLLRTSNVEKIFSDLKEPTSNNLTLKELRELDMGTWFNKKNPERARAGFVGAKILTFKDVIMIAEGYQIKKLNGEPVKEIVENKWTGKYLYEKDPQDNKNRPGIYAETKKLHLEKLLANELKTHGWLITDNPKEIETYTGKVAIANSNARFILQSFYRESIEELNILLPGVPKCLLIWEPLMSENLKKNYIETINYCLENKVEIIGPSISGAPNNYGELSAPWMVELVHNAGLLMHPYTFDTNNDFSKYAKSVDGVFTNRADLALEFFNRLEHNDSNALLKELGY